MGSLIVSDPRRAPWRVEYEGRGFERFYLGLPKYEQAVLQAAIEHVLAREGMDVLATEWGKPLGQGLSEFRVRRSLEAIFREAGVPVPDDVAGSGRRVLLRVFCTFRGERVVLLLGGYDKGRDPSDKRQQKEIARARKVLKQWLQEQRRR